MDFKNDIEEIISFINCSELGSNEDYTSTLKRFTGKVNEKYLTIMRRHYHG